MSVIVSVRTNPSGIGSGGQPLIEKHAKTLHIFILVKLSNAGSQYVAGGETLDLTTIFGSGGLPGYSFPTAALPEKVELQSVRTPGQTTEFVYQYVPGATLANGSIQVFTGAAAQSGLTELANGNYPAGVLNDVIEGEVILPVP